jgi:ornithine cyclodeaminase
MTELVFAIGGTAGAGSVGGVRAYVSRNTAHLDDQLVAVWNLESGALKGVVLGAALGAVRMGAIGGAAIRALARADASVVAVVGIGRQAATHLAAAAAVRPLREARVFGRSAARSADFARLMEARLGLPVRAAASARAAVEGADIVLLATSSYRPVIEAAWLAPGTFVHTVGFKSSAAKEMGLDVAERADLVATDSPAQVAAFGRTFVLAGTRHQDRLVDLAEIVAGHAPGRTDPSMITVCYPLGLAGAEIVLAADLLERRLREPASGDAPSLPA